MKKFVVLTLLLLATLAFGEDFSGVVDSIEQEGETIRISGVEYRITGASLVYINDIRVTLDGIEPGMTVNYSLGYDNVAKPLVSKMVLDVSEEKAAIILGH
ncbi:hypothetical protein SAMN02745866_00122 [Alteromonadaceae bacterium Bs31]|nr:hypothetical protein SAMN02745866_00122 [Alteromonadaceae bacterium Bs31]